MIKSYLKSAFRSFYKNKGYSLINMTGLSVGMAVSLLIGLWVWDELSFDSNFQNHNRIAQVIQNVTNNGKVQTWRQVPYPLAAELRKSYGGDFKYVLMSTSIGNHTLAWKDKILTKSGAFFDIQAPEMLSLKMIKGDRTALQDPSSLIISETTARAYFGASDPLFKILKIDNGKDAKVMGVYEDLPKNSSFSGMDFIAPFQMFVTMAGLDQLTEPWRPNFLYLYVQLADNANLSRTSLKIRDVKLHHVSGQLSKKKPALFLQPMDKWHLYDEFRNGINTGGRIQYVWLFGIIAVFVVLLACINFMNLSTARSENRAREVGIRKTIGSRRIQLISQFFCESMLCVMIALVLSLIMVAFSLPLFNKVADKQMSILWSNPYFWLIITGFSLITGLIAGSYPAFYLSSFTPVKVLKGTFRVGRLAAVPRKMLVVLQFTVSVILITGTMVVFRQIQFAKNRPIGYSRDGLVSVPVDADEIHKHFDAVASDLLKTGAVVSMAEASAPTTRNGGSTSAIEWPGKDPNLSVDFPQNNVSIDYGKTVGWQFAEGRDFSRLFLSDSSAVIVNETAIYFMGIKKPVGTFIKYYDNLFQVIGVTKDMIIESPYDQVRPTIYFLSRNPGRVVLLKINPYASPRVALNRIKTIFKKYNPAQPFEYQFADLEYARKFGNEERIGQLASAFAGLAIFISCLGLFGMAAFMAERRIKEIGVRKVLGASAFSLWRLMSKEFVLLVIISLFIAIPIAYFAMYNWLSHYDYHADIAWWLFAITGMATMAIALLTVSYQSIKAALTNPVENLRTE